MTQYDDIIDHPHHVSRNHPQMSMHDRVAQFSPFAALVGYENVITDAAKEHIRRGQNQSETEYESQDCIDNLPGGTL